ncbi:MAG: type II secretion system F family protein [Actinobacteria bacterium]|nr:type II secretion system F family protein [Actinomycetota bacterium]NIT95844.1 type II secretion system F family protein [Actinomycetota bacterium]NIU22136.1 type II secretion system F family protein [Actinomycetota bacterium]NIV56017.1 type II secretion system F family protein [Actinomycetota bacterium]NIX50828.1 type II secretion system F family protein [Actinomycetota bacterium]
MFELDPQIAAALVGGGIALVIWALASQAHEKSVVRDSLRALEDYEVESVRDQELLNPLAERALLPVLGALTNIGRRLTPVGYVDGVRHKFVLSGRPSPDIIDRFLAVRVVTVVLVPVSFWFFYIWNPLGVGGNTQMGITALVALTLILGPDAKLNRAVEDRQKSIMRGLPDIIDLLVISVEAGLGFEQALQRTIVSVPGPLSEEFARMLGEVRAGSTRAEAMRAMDARIEVTEVRSFVLAILQADTFGVSIGRVLRAQAEEMRIKRRQLAQEKAQKAPVKMLIPMVFCIFPALFTVVLGPAVIRIMQNF